jgi:hypothetical protein
MEVMVHPLDLRFKYHFSGDKPTNRLDKVNSSVWFEGVLDLITCLARILFVAHHGPYQPIRRVLYFLLATNS